MSLMSLQKATLTIASHTLLDSVDWVLQPKDKIALVGRNGAGKSSLLKLLQGQYGLESGQLLKTNGIRIGQLVQDVPDFKADHRTIQQFLFEKSERLSEWDQSHQIDEMTSRLGLPNEAKMSELSGGMIRRVLLAAVLLEAPDVLLLDEPTNHLDIQSIEWLEAYLSNYHGALILVTHDRMFLDKVATQIVELDRGKLYTYACSYDTFLKRRDERLSSEAKHNQLFDKRLGQEEVWIRKGIEARRTRNEGRVRKLKLMREEYKQRKLRQAQVKQMTLETSRSGQLVMEAIQLNYQIDDKLLIKDFSLILSRGDKIGIVGPNGCGKTTLIRLLMQFLEPTSGTVRHGTALDVAYFEQMRHQLDEQQSVMHNVADGADYVMLNGQRKHVASYLQDFLFTPDRFNQSVSSLSGGERNRLLLAKLFAKPVNLLVMDEPTNDLDIETLELLESLLVDYTGTLLLISHDRAFINDVVTSVLVYEGDGQFNDYVGGYDTYCEIKKQTSSPKMKLDQKRPKQKTSKLSYHEQRELAMLPDKIAKLEAEINQMHAQMAESRFYQQSAEALSVFNTRLSQQETLLVEWMTRWEELESR